MVYHIDARSPEIKEAQEKLLNECKYHAPDGLEITGVSSYVQLDDGSKAWVKTSKEKKKEALHRQAIVDTLSEHITPLKPLKRDLSVNEDMMTCYILSDFHLGMYTSKLEGGVEWSTDKARQVLDKWIDVSVAWSPQSHTGVLLQLGDFFHFDGIEPVTPMNKHVLDADVRYSELIRLGVESLRRAVVRMLQRHEHVHVIMATGNHDLSSSVWLRYAFEILFQDNPRVTVDTTESGYYCYEWGNTSIFAHHGHKRNLTNVDQTFAAYYRDVYGRTKYSYGHIGHFHHSKPYTSNLMQVEIHPTLAPKDNYALVGGYSADRGSKSVTYRKDTGKFLEYTVTPGMLL